MNMPPARIFQQWSVARVFQGAPWGGRNGELSGLVRSRSLVLVLLGTLLSAHLNAGEVLSATTGHEGRRYTLLMTMHIDGDPAAVRRIVTDYEALERISDTIVDSHLINAEGKPLRREMALRTCILFFCFKATLVEDIEENAGGETIIATVVEGAGDFRYGRTVWRMTPSGGGTDVVLETVIVPDFWIPPLIGPLVIKQKMRRDAEQSIFAIERLAIDQLPSGSPHDPR
ncbi:MAG: SRPBCC family protein [Pseudomonadales bacterium]|nr:SRPBCC family protein [Pseudomonadales bacterium]